MCEELFNDRRIITFWLLLWTVVTCVVFFWIMYVDDSPFLQFGPNEHTQPAAEFAHWMMMMFITIFAGD